ncbi:hypothetical protein [Polaromonas sp. YR568]|uniref:phage adaptor protein n=1 Tax=Polaromonas sp. YR568 TaxID=1855301 RepID=UPI00313784B5
MTTASEVIELALRDSGAYGEGEPVSAGDSSDAFTTLKQLLALWQIDGLMVYAQVTSSFAATGALSYTVGATGDVAITRPDKIDGAFWRSGTLDYPIAMLDSYEEYLDIVQKTLGSDPQYAFYLPSYPLGTLYLYPQPSSGTVHLTRLERLPSLTSITDTIVLPEAYMLPIRYSLGEIFLMMFDLPANPKLERMAANARRLIGRNNLRINSLGMPAGIPLRLRSNILTG